MNKIKSSSLENVLKNNLSVYCLFMLRNFIGTICFEIPELISPKFDFQTN